MLPKDRRLNSLTAKNNIHPLSWVAGYAAGVKCNTSAKQDNTRDEDMITSGSRVLFIEYRPIQLGQTKIYQLLNNYCINSRCQNITILRETVFSVYNRKTSS